MAAIDHDTLIAIAKAEASPTMCSFLKDKKDGTIGVCTDTCCTRGHHDKGGKKCRFINAKKFDKKLVPEEFHGCFALGTFAPKTAPPVADAPPAYTPATTAPLTASDPTPTAPSTPSAPPTAPATLDAQPTPALSADPARLYEAALARVLMTFGNFDYWVGEKISPADATKVLNQVQAILAPFARSHKVDPGAPLKKEACDDLCAVIDSLADEDDDDYEDDDECDNYAGSSVVNEST